MRKSLVTIIGLLVMCFTGIMISNQADAETTEESILVAELRVDGQFTNPNTEALSFGFGGGLILGCPECCPYNYFGLDGWFYPKDVGTYVDYDRDHEDFSVIVDDWLSDGEVGTYVKQISVLDPDNDNLCHSFYISGGANELDLDGIHTPPDLAGCTIDFVRLFINKIEFVNNNVEYDISWQFWGGKPPSLDGGGQRSDVDDFLIFANPVEKSTTVPSSVDHFNVYIFYGTTIDETTFEATLNGEPFNNFNPLPGTREILTIPLFPGRNTLLVKVAGIRTDGRTATDRDRLTFVVE